MKGYRTLILNLVAGILPILQATNTVDLGLGGKGALIYSGIVAAANFALRFFTTTPVGTAASN